MLHPLNKRNVRCSICGNFVALEFSKTDEQGTAVHEECYVGRTIALLEAQRRALQLSSRPLLVIDPLITPAFARE